MTLRDGALTARVLRLANSVLDNPVGQPNALVSRAVVRRGFDPVCRITLPIATLLRRLGHMGFWCYPYGRDGELLQELEPAGGNEALNRDKP